MLWRQRPRAEDLSTLSNIRSSSTSNLPAIAPGRGLDQLGDFLIRSMRAFFTPMKSFATGKALLFATFAASLMAGKVSVAYSAGRLLAKAAISDPTTGQVAVAAAIVIALVFFNFKALQMTFRARAESNQALLRVLESPNVSAKLKQQVLAGLKD